MGLHGEGAVVIDKRRVLAELVAGRDLGAGGQLHDLILVPGIQRQRLAAEIVVLRADGPAAGMLLDPPAKRLRDDLVAEADADHRDMGGIGAADEILERGDKGVILVDAVARAGQQPAFGLVHVLGEVHRFHMPGAEGEAASGQQALKHVGVVAHLVLQLGGRLAALKYADTHEKPCSCGLRSR